MKKVYIIVSSTNTIFSKIISFHTKNKYSHTSICLSEKLDCFYSFSRKYTLNPFVGAFVIEEPNKDFYGLYKNIPCKILEAEVDDFQYNLMKLEVDNFCKNKQKYKYNYLGILYAIINKPYNQKNHYYCFEFVHHILKAGKLLTNEFDNIFVKPSHFLSLGYKVVYDGNLNELPRHTKKKEL